MNLKLLLDFIGFCAFVDFKDASMRRSIVNPENRFSMGTLYRWTRKDQTHSTKMLNLFIRASVSGNNDFSSCLIYTEEKVIGTINGRVGLEATN